MAAEELETPAPDYCGLGNETNGTDGGDTCSVDTHCSSESDEGAGSAAQRRIARILSGVFGCPTATAAAAALDVQSDAAADVLERWLAKRPPVAEAADGRGEVEALQAALCTGRSKACQEASQCILRCVGLVLQPLSEDVLDFAYWADKLDELAEQSVGSFNTLHRYSTNIANTPFPYHDILEALEPTLRGDFGLEPSALRLHAAFFIHYGPMLNKDLRRHVDASLLTVNLCLRTDGLRGCGVRFHGRRALLGQCNREGSDAEDDSTAEADAPKSAPRSDVAPLQSATTLVEVPDGCALVHWGDHEHETLPWEAGDRWSVILWFES